MMCEGAVTGWKEEGTMKKRRQDRDKKIRPETYKNEHNRTGFWCRGLLGDVAVIRASRLVVPSQDD